MSMRELLRARPVFAHVYACAQTDFALIYLKGHFLRKISNT